MQVDYRCELQFALVGGDLGQIPNPRHVRRLPRAEVPAQQVRGLTRRLIRLGGAVPAAFASSHQALFAHQRRDGVRRYLPAHIPQIGGDPRRTVGLLALVKQVPDGGRQRFSPLPTRRAVASAPLIKPRLRHPQRPARHHMWDTVLCPLGGDQRGQAHRRIASLTQRAICPDLASKHVTVHTLRHTAAMRFLEAGIDAAVIALWLGHESQATTSIYLHADIAMKRKALERTRQPDTLAGEYQPADPLLTWLQSL